MRLKPEATCKRMLRIKPRAGRAHQRLIYFYAMTLQRTKMVRQIREAIRLGCEPKEAYVYLVLTSALDFSDGFYRTTAWLQGSPNDESLQVARAYYLSKLDKHRAAPVFPDLTTRPEDDIKTPECLQAHPHHSEVLAFHLQQEITTGKQERVARLLGQAPVSAETDARFWRFRGWLLAGQDRLEEAEEAFNEALRLNPYEWRTRHELAALMRRRGRLKEGATMSELAIKGKTIERVSY